MAAQRFKVFKAHDIAVDLCRHALRDIPVERASQLTEKCGLCDDDQVFKQFLAEGLLEALGQRVRKTLTFVSDRVGGRVHGVTRIAPGIRPAPTGPVGHQVLVMLARLAMHQGLNIPEPCAGPALAAQDARTRRIGNQYPDGFQR